MSSKAQKRHGYPLPADEWTEETQSFCIIIPAGEEYAMAMTAHLRLLGKWWWWKRDPDRPKAASDAATTWRTLFQISEDCGMSIDYEALKQAIKEAGYETINDVAKQIVSGRTTNISVDNEGGVSDPTTDGEGAGVPDDDPETEAIDESLASIMGGAISVSRALEKYFDKCDSLYGAVNGSPTVALASAQAIIKAYYPNDGAQMDTAIATYYTYRGTNGQLSFNTSATFERFMFCRGYNELAFNQWLIDLSGFAEAKRSVMSDLVVGLSEEFFSHYFAIGAAVPSIDYKAASCTKVPTEQFTLDMSTNNAPQFTTAQIWKGGHRFLITASGTYFDSDVPNEFGDAMWFYNTATGVKAFSSMTFNSAGGVTNPTQAQVPYESSHVYQFTVEKAQGSADGACIITRDNGSLQNLPNVSGILTITVEDLGDFSI